MLDNVISPVKIKYNRKLLNDYISTIKIWPDYSPDNGKSVLQHKDILFPINIEVWRIKAFLRESSTYSFSWVPPGAKTGYHSDSNRGCTLILPINTEPHLIKFKINDKVYDYYYDGPVITNAKSIHNGVNHTDHNRFNLLFHFDKSYDEVKELNDKDKLVSSWIQVYPIVNNTNIKAIDDYFNPTGKGIEINLSHPLHGKKSIKVGDRSIHYDKANDYDICLGIKYMLENKTCLHLELI